MLKKTCLGLAAVAALGFAFAGPAPAKADSISMSYSSGGYYRGGHHRGYHGGHWHRRHLDRHWAPPPVVVYEEPLYVVPAPQPILYPPPSYEPPVRNNVVETDDGQTCREYQTRIRIDGKLQNAYGTTCLQPDGSWQNVN